MAPPQCHSPHLGLGGGRGDICRSYPGQGGQKQAPWGSGGLGLGCFTPTWAEDGPSWQAGSRGAWGPLLPSPSNVRAEAGREVQPGPGEGGTAHPHPRAKAGLRAGGCGSAASVAPEFASQGSRCLAGGGCGASSGSTWVCAGEGRAGVQAAAWLGPHPRERPQPAPFYTGTPGPGPSGGGQGRGVRVWGERGCGDAE